ncbi:Ig-like domain-containing protein [Neorhizobium petrolearium]|uniref:Ig-like domain-containing protein n=1 Tax=Neorhizobium petrolearium TaxID=515361 RepID=A0ABY8M4M0_9HYPH|nr:Ig-like domain-containing protein [Neorhizobium petrolearium]MCC2609176.1 Ig-like domain-containing protein [Neorhizobium petrolearium]WGI69404.1 Ig-like domain-containing protein [Neorhizobium petrolearium]
MMRNRAGWLAITALAIASLLMVFFVLPRINHDAKPVGDAINAAGNAVKEAVTETQQATRTPDTSKPAELQAAAPQAGAPAAQPGTSQSDATKANAMTSPSFDVLRVEPDGSTVIAGRAEPHSTIEVTNGTSVVAKVNVGPSGDFAAVLDEPLPPGDHELVLRATGKDGKATISEETATVSVPADKSGKLLAMVTKPGKASRVIAMPAQNKPAASVPEQPSPTVPAASASETATSPATAPATSVAGAPTALPAPPAGSSGLASSAPDIAALTPNSTAPAGTLASSELHITAVEIEGTKIFVAGVSKAGTSLRGQADGKLIGAAKAGQDGSFVIEGNMELAVGDHRISVEALSATGQVVVRVEVPFNRPAGEQVAAVAAPQQGGNAMVTLDDAAFDKLRNETVRAFNLLRGLYDGGNIPSMEQMIAARSATSIALRSLSEYRLPADAAAASRSVAETTAKDAAAALAALDALPKEVAAVGAGLKEIAAMIAKAVGPVIAQQLAGVEMAAVVPVAATDASGAKTIQQAPLTQSTRNSVIIRRGDTLWQISRRVYGQGVRYTTIYLANEDQIRNPDIIQPGQIFGVPEEYRPDSEELHRQRMLQKRS